ncbi:MAG: hypothetical protein RIT45_2133 [Pseudomonadota bacterium]
MRRSVLSGAHQPAAAALVALRAMAWLLVLGCAAPAFAQSARKTPTKGAKAASDAEARVRRSRAAELLRKIEQTRPGPDRYKLVDGVIELGDDAWPTVEPALARLSGLAEGEAVVVDLLLGFMPTSYDKVVETAPKLADEAAWRVVRFVLRLPEDDRQLALLRTMLPRNDERILLAIVPPLVAKGEQAVFPRLVALVDESRPQLAAFAIDVLAANRYEAAMPALVRLLGIEARRATQSNLPMRLKLINAIARIGGEPAVPPLMEALQLPDQRRAVKDGLRLVGAPAVRAALFLLRTATGSRLVVALELLEYLRVEAATELVTLLRAGDASTRELALDVLAYIGVADVRPQVAQVVRERRVGDISGLLRLCSALYDDEVRKLMFELLESPDSATRKATVDALWRLRDPKTYRVLRVVAAQDRDDDVRIAAIRAVAGTADPKGIALLRKMVRVPNHTLKMVLVQEISRVDNWLEGATALLPLLGDPDDAVFRAALATIERMTFHSGPRRGGGWKAWLAQQKARQVPDFEKAIADEARYVVAEREMSVMVRGDDDVTLALVSGPPYRDATHLVPWAWQLEGNHRVAVMRRAPWPFRASRDGGYERWSAEVDGMLGRLGKGAVVLVADLGGAAYAMRYAAEHRKAVSHVVLLGGPWPSAEALERLPAEVVGAVPDNARADLEFGLGAGWQYAPEQARHIAMRGLLHGALGVRAIGPRLHWDNLADDAFEPILLERMRNELADFEPGLTPQPVLVVLGDKAPWAESTRKALEPLTTRKRNPVRIALIRGAGAMPLAEKPEETRAAIRGFLDP